MDKKEQGGDELRKLLGSLLGKDNVPDDVVIQAAINDNRIQKIAEYDLTKGYTNIKVSPEQLNEKFSEFKTAILKKSSTLAELETTIFSRWGVLEKPRLDMPKAQMQMPELNGVTFSESKPITGFTTEKEAPRKQKKKSTQS